MRKLFTPWYQNFCSFFWLSSFFFFFLIFRQLWSEMTLYQMWVGPRHAGSEEYKLGLENTGIMKHSFILYVRHAFFEGQVCPINHVIYLHHEKLYMKLWHWSHFEVPRSHPICRKYSSNMSNFKLWISKILCCSKDTMISTK